MENHYFEELLAIMCVSLVATVLLQRLKLPQILAYLLAGALIGPYVLGWVDNPEDFAFLAEFGVVFLLFSLGLEFSLPKLISLRHSVFGVGSIQVTVCSLIFGLAAFWWGATLEAAVIIAGSLALSSTAIVTKELGAMRQINSRHGQLSIGILLFQDLAAVIFLILVPVLAGNGTESFGSALALALVKGFALVVVLLSVGKWVLPYFYQEVARARSDEIFVLSTVVIVTLAAWVTHNFELSMALGGFVIGMMLGESHFRHQIDSDIGAFKDILLGLFFVTIGMSVQVELLFEFWPRILIFTLGLIFLKVFVVAVIVRVLGGTRHTSIQTGLNLAQAGEFGMALLALAVMHEVLPSEQASFILIVAILSMAVSPLLIRHSQELSQRFLQRIHSKASDEDAVQLEMPDSGHAIIGGYGRVGRTIARLMQANQIPYVVIEQNNEVVIQARQLDPNVIFGDCTRMKILERCHIGTAKLAVLTFNSIEIAKDTVEHIRAAGIDVPIIVRTQEHGDFAELMSLGADYVIPEMLEVSLLIGRRALSFFDLDEAEIERNIEVERNEHLTRT